MTSTAEVAACYKYACSMTDYADLAQCVAKKVNADYLRVIAATSDYTSAEVIAACDAANYAAAYARVAYIAAQTAAYVARHAACDVGPADDTLDARCWPSVIETCVSAYSAAARLTATTEISRELLEEADQSRMEEREQCMAQGIPIVREAATLNSEPG